MRLALCAALCVAGGALAQQYSNPFCGYAKERNTVSVMLTCAPGAGVINAVTFAAFGTPTGSCGTFAHDPACDAPNFAAVVEAVRLGEAGLRVVGLLWRQALGQCRHTFPMCVSVSVHATVGGVPLY
jgi:hypothetical protein